MLADSYWNRIKAKVKAKVSEEEFRYTYGYFPLGKAAIIPVTQPLSTVIVNLQNSKDKFDPILNPKTGKMIRRSPYFEIAKQIHAKEGYRGFYKGVTTATFKEYGKSLYKGGLLLQAIKKGEELEAKVHTNNKIFNGIVKSLTSTVLFVTADGVLVGPFEALKTWQQKQPKGSSRYYPRYLWDQNKRFKSKPIRGAASFFSLWHGFNATWWKQFFQQGSFIVLHELMTDLLASKNEKHPVACGLTTSIVAGAGAPFISSPIDRVKSLVQGGELAAYSKGKTGTFNILHQVYKNEGIKGVYKGALGNVALRGAGTIGTGIFLSFIKERRRKNKEKAEMDALADKVSGIKLDDSTKNDLRPA